MVKSNKTSGNFLCENWFPLLWQPLPLSCPDTALVLLWHLAMMVMMIQVMILMMKIFLPVDSKLSKCCGEEEIFYQDTMECGPDKVGYGV